MRNVQNVKVWTKNDRKLDERSATHTHIYIHLVEPIWPNAHGSFDPQVHMGTHMWTNGASRRGRRMSLDLPPLPITPKDSEFLQRRPDLFYPYLPAPFLNGVQQKVSDRVFLVESFFPIIDHV